MKIFLLILCLISLNLSASTAHKSKEYGELNDILDMVRNRTESKYIVVSTKVKLLSDKLKYSDLKVWLSRDDKEIQAITVNEEGTIHLPILNSEDAKQTKLNINQPDGAVNILLSTSVIPPEVKQLSYRELFIVLKDTNNFISEMAGAISWFVPNVDGLKFKFEESATVTILSKKKKITYETDDDFEVKIDVKKSLMKENPQVMFSLLPIEVSPVD